jgi:Ni/Fe-hydrogenase subunit HybB-like protein
MYMYDIWIMYYCYFIGFVYAFGGYDVKASEYLSTVQQYNPVTRVWTVLPEKLHMGRSLASAIYIRKWSAFVITGMCGVLYTCDVLYQCIY